ncbi:MAG: methyl-accepting chemotaxis protein [Pseudomonadota bacterium]
MTNAAARTGLSLGLKIALWAAGGSLLLSAILIALGHRSAAYTARDVFVEKTHQVAVLSAAGMGGAVRFGKTDVLEAQLAGFADAMDGALAGAVVMNAEGQVLAAIGAADAARALAQQALGGEAASAEDGGAMAAPIRFGAEGGQVGALGVRWSFEAIDAATAAASTRLAAWGAVAAALFAGLAALASRRVVARPLSRMADAVSDLVREVPAEIPGTGRSDEIGGLARALTSIHAKGEEATRTRAALEASQTLLMIADEDRRIVYFSPALRQFLKDRAETIRKELPRFDPTALEGVTIDAFHAKPEHQARMLDRMTSTMRTELRLGGLRIDLMVAPVFAADGRRLGTATLWNDRTQEARLLDEIDAAAKAAAEGRFDQRVGTEGAGAAFARAAEGVNAIAESVGRFLEDVERPVTGLADGDLSHRCASDHAGRFAEVAGSVNSSIDRIANLAADIREAETSMRGSIDAVSSGSQDLSSRTEAQASALEETSATVEEVSATISSNADSAGSARDLAKEAFQRAEEGREVVESAVTSMSEIEESSRRIEDITAVIDSIAFQTNLLALNAAVEAARAGEAGKGFAVVASEVRTLAQRSSEAARDIKELIAASSAKVSDGVRHVNATGEALSGLAGSMTSVVSTIEDIARASAEQATAMQEITSAVSHLDEATQRNASLAEDSSREAEALRARSDGLAELVGFFREGPAAEPRPLARSA